MPRQQRFVLQHPSPSALARLLHLKTSPVNVESSVGSAGAAAATSQSLFFNL